MKHVNYNQPSAISTIKWKFCGNEWDGRESGWGWAGIEMKSAMTGGYA